MLYPKRNKKDIKWSIDYDTIGHSQIILVGDYANTRFYMTCSSAYFGLSIRYRKWLIRLKFNALFD